MCHRYRPVSVPHLQGGRCGGVSSFYVVEIWWKSRGGGGKGGRGDISSSIFSRSGERGYIFSFHHIPSTAFFHHVFPPRKNRRCRPIIIIIFFLYFLIKKERKKFCKATTAEGVYGGNIWWKPLHLSRFTFINLPWSFAKSI